MHSVWSILLLLFSLPAYANKQPKAIEWIMVDFAPYYIMHDKYEGTGRDESVIKLLEKALPEVSFKRTLLPASRAVHELSNPHNNYCMLSLYQNEHRKQHIQFTEHSSTVGLSPSIAIRKELAAKLELDVTKPVSLKSLLAENLALGVSMSRSFGTNIDKVINESHDANIISRPGRDTLASLTYMLQKKRIDILLGYPSEHYYLAHSMGFEDELTQITLTEAPALSIGYVGCTKNKQGEVTVKLLDQTLEKIAHTDAFHDVLVRWLPDNLQPILEKRLKDRNESAAH
ncbi:TIGR02285 family protein [Pseudoalteromonas shioyasakiensis]|uniref:TIGR02285 family protein n=1 Tax=Pseudoalteromonas shioyasakiensis TaxID=1190813 RepID=UPI0021185574|nr:TIGR02285 family protein [Pseudoalteromonas shioyasakiensis]MCQ8881769.1 TIGR02285 family protein [Pseudoalteromonas shioyasakiensis]